MVGTTIPKPVSRRSEAETRVLCYVLGPISAALILQFRRYGGLWSIRFHAFHSILLTACWAAAWGALRLAEAVSPWLLATTARQARFAMNLGFLVGWATLVVTAYGGRRCAMIPPVHELAVWLARKSEKHWRPVYTST